MPNHLPAPLKVAAKIELGTRLPVALPFNVNYDGYGDDHAIPVTQPVVEFQHAVLQSSRLVWDKGSSDHSLSASITQKAVNEQGKD